MIYLDSAATSLQKPPQVGSAMEYAVSHYSSPGRGGYSTSAAAGELAYRCRRLAGELFQTAGPEQVVFTSSATHGLNIAIRTLVKPGGKVMISGYEHNGVTRTLESIPEVTATVLGGRLFAPEEMLRLIEEHLDGSYDAVILCYVSNVFGYVLPVAEMAAVCRERGVPLIVDASQAAGVYPIRLRDWGADFAAMPGHKGLYGPQGIGLLLCGREEVTPLITGGTGSNSMDSNMPEFLPDRLEAGTHNMPGIAGLYQGMRFVRAVGTERIRRWEEGLKDCLVNGLGTMEDVEVFAGPSQAGVVSFRTAAMDCEVLGNELAERGIAVRAGLHCAPLAHETAGTLESGTVRVSVSAFTHPREVELFLCTLDRILRKSKEKSQKSHLANGERMGYNNL